MRISDAHVEFHHHPDDMKYARNPSVLKGQIDAEIINKERPDLLFLAIFSGPDDNQWEKFFWVTKKYKKTIKKNKWHLVLDKNDLKKKGTKIILHLEGLLNFEGDLSKLDRIYDLGIRSVGLTHDESNEFSGSCFNSDQGLTDFGRKVVKRLFEKGIVIDCAHLSPKAIKEICRDFDYVPFISHTGICGSFPDVRNIDNKILKLVKRRRGFVGIGLAGSMIKKSKAQIKDVLEHIFHAQKIAGIDKIGIGSDFGGIDTYLIKGLEDFTSLKDLDIYIIDRGFFGNNLKNYILRSNLVESQVRDGLKI